MQGTEGYYQVTSQEFLDQWNTLAQESKLVAIFMSGLEESGKYWCPDCEATRDNLNNVLVPTAREKGIKAYHVDAGNRETWKNPENPLRKNEAFPVTKIPTIILFENVMINCLSQFLK